MNMPSHQHNDKVFAIRFYTSPILVMVVAVLAIALPISRSFLLILFALGVFEQVLRYFYPSELPSTRRTAPLKNMLLGLLYTALIALIAFLMERIPLWEWALDGVIVFGIALFLPRPADTRFKTLNQWSAIPFLIFVLLGLLGEWLF